MNNVHAKLSRISRQALTLHHKKHHAKHVAIINGMIRGTEMEKDSLEVLACTCPADAFICHGFLVSL